MQISNIKTSISKNFLQSEFYSGSPDAPDFHYLNDKIVPLAQYLRDYFDTPIKVNSTFRTKYHNTLIGGSSNSQHLKGNAIDLKFTKGSHILLENDILNKGNLFKTLLLMGLTGVGLYDNFIHLDFREEKGNQNFEEFNYAFWDNRIKKKDFEIMNLIKGENKRYINIPILVLSLIYLIKKVIK